MATLKALRCMVLSGLCCAVMGCGGGTGTANPPTPTPTPSPTPAAAGALFYVDSGGASGQVSGFTVSTTGSLTPVPVRNVGSQPKFMSTRSDSLMLFVPNSADGTLNAIIVHTFGDLTLDGTASGLSQPVQAVPHPNNNFVFVLQGPGGVRTFSVNNSATLAAVGGTTATPPGTPTHMAINATGSLLFVGIDGGAVDPSGIQAYSVNASTGVLTAGPFKTFTAAPVDVEVSSAGLVGAVSAGAGSTVSTFTAAADGTLSAAGSAAADAQAAALLFTGTSLFVGNGSGTISAFQVAVNGTLSTVSGSPFTSAAGTSDLAVTQDGHFLASANTTANTLTVFSISASGALSNVATQNVAGGPISVTAAFKTQ